MKNMESLAKIIIALGNMPGSMPEMIEQTILRDVFDYHHQPTPEKKAKIVANIKLILKTLEIMDLEYMVIYQGLTEAMGELEG